MLRAVRGACWSNCRTASPVFRRARSSSTCPTSTSTTIPAALSTYAGIDREVVVAGVDDHLEIWDRTAWRTLAEDFEGSAEDVAERLAATGH